MFGANWCSAPLALEVVSYPHIQLSGVLYEQGPVQQDQELQSGATVEGTSQLVAHRLTNI